MHAMTSHEKAVRAHCEQRRIRIETLPSGAIRFTGRDVAITSVDFKSVSLECLEKYQATKGDALKADWMHQQRK
jgi:hypothetical protein